jgi:PPOX class probable F420-dependent enzyme
MAQLPDWIREGVHFAHFGTAMKDGWPQVTPVWYDVEGDQLILNTAEGRLKWKNVKRDPRVSVEIQDANNAYHYVMIKGRVVEMTTEGADAHIDKLAKKYLGVDSYPNRTPTEVRVILRVAPEKISGMG